MDQFKGQPRLPKFAVPKRYDLRLTPDLVACTFTGTVAIDLDVVADTRFIVLNAADLSFNDASVSFTPHNSSQALAAPKVSLFEEDEILVLEFAENLPHGVGVLQMAFSGILSDKMKGFYKSTYEHNGEKKNMAVTQFEPADARRCFPCWDEPACKATFKITLEVPSDLVALSNMPVVDEKVNGNVKVVSYQESPIMSTYLVAIVVGLFDYVEDHTSDGIKVRVYCQVGKADQGKFALHVGAKTLDLFKEYFAVPYPLPKIDMIAIPDFAAGAMENYGLVTYRETALLYDEQHSAASNKQRVATVVAHELAHQWFGNLVTMEWWTHLWLNEGFATWVSYLATDSLFPEWKIWTQFLDESTEGLRLDGLEESHPIEVEVNHASEIDEIFDAISYRKGASVIRMLQSYLGAEVFQKSLAAYVKRHAYSNAKTEDLWTALEEGSGEPVNKLMSSWTKQMGYPVVSAKLKDGKLELEQSRFLSSGSPGEGQWIVPVTLCCGSYDVRKNFLLESKSGAYDIKELLGCSVGDGTCSWIKINVDQAGFYRVKYDDTLAAGLRKATESQSLTAIDRYGILDDSFALCMARQQSLASLLTLISAYKKELDYTVLSNLIVISYKVVKIAADVSLELTSGIKQFFIGVFQLAAGRLGWDPKQGESHLDAMLRGEVLTALAAFGHDETLKEAIRRFDAFLADRNTSLLPPDLRRAAYVAVMQRANKSDKMAPEVIEMSGVCAASDIWSVGCTVIELLTCVPPYYDLQPMPALFRIVQDDSPPIPDSLSPDITDFLRQCFKKDSRQRPDAKTLLSHPWIRNSRRALQSSLRHSGTIRYMKGADSSSEKDGEGSQDIAESVSAEKVGMSKTNSKSKLGVGSFRSEKDQSSASDIGEERADSEDDIMSDQGPTLSIHDNKSSLQSSTCSISSDAKGTSQDGKSEPDGNLEMEASEGRRKASATKQVGKESSIQMQQRSHSFGPKGEDRGLRKAVKTPSSYGGNELTRFSDPPGDACLHDLFHPLNKVPEGKLNEASASTPASNANQGDSPVADGGKNDLATKLRARIAQKQMEGETGHSNDGGDLFRLMMGVLKDDVIDIDGLVFDEKASPDNLLPLQAVEFSRLVSSLRPSETEDAIVTSCQKLVAMFRHRPEQKVVFVTQHGFLPVMDLLDSPKSRVTCAVLQLINEIIKDNIDFQENACLVGLIPLVMSFAGPERDRSREIRKEAAYFLQQLCQSSSLTLQMFIACRGIPVLVGFLEADYAKYREMVHLAIDGMWQVFKLKRSTPRNDFCRIAAKNGILLRLINTLYSLNEATLLASEGRSGQLDQHEALLSVIDHPDVLKTRPGGGEEPSNSQRSDLYQPDGDRPRSSSAALDATEDVKQHHRISISSNRTSTDKIQKLAESASNGYAVTQPEQVRPLLSLLEKEPPSRHVSGQLDYVKHIAGLEKHESILPLLRASIDTMPRYFSKTMSKKVMAIEGAASASGVLSGSGVLNARLGSDTSSGLLSHMVTTLSAEVASQYLEKVADLLLEFARADTTVKSYMCSQSLLSRLFHMFNRVEPPILLKILKCTNHLSTDPNCLESLQRADAIKHLIPNLEVKEGNLVDQIHHEVLSALFNLCKINKRRQEQAAENGIIPHLMLFVMSDSPLKQYALPLLCDMAHASRNSREQLRSHGGLDVYLSLLDDEYWSVIALDSIAVCLAQDNDNRKVEQALLKDDAIYTLVNFFQSCPERHFVHILEPFLKIITKSSRINTTLAVNGLTPLLIARLDHQDAIARLNLLKLIKAVYEHHPRPKQLIVENDLPQRLQNLIEERREGQHLGGQVLVKQMATSLLKALHINTVL